MAADKKDTLKSNASRLDSLLESLLRFTTMDFSEKAKISEKGDEIDALAAGINTLVEELVYRITKANESEEKFRLLVDEIKDYAIFMLDPKGKILTWNAAAAYLMARTALPMLTDIYH